jgi:hypothetical protein
MYQVLQLFMRNRLRKVLLAITVLAGIGISGWAITSMMIGHLEFRPELYALCVLNVMAGVLLLIFDAS